MTKEIHNRKKENSDESLIKEKEKEISHLQDLIKSKEKQIEELEKALNESQDLIFQIHQSPLAQLYRKYDNTIGKLFPIRPKKSFTKNLSSKKSVIIKNFLDSGSQKKDIICFPMIDWDYRTQRPHHLLREFANKGHRIFYLTTTLSIVKNSLDVKELENNIFQIDIGLEDYFDIYKDKFNSKSIKLFAESFTQFIKQFKIDPIIFVMFPTWAPLIQHLHDVFKFHILFDCADEISEFPNQSKIDNEEKILTKMSDLVLTSSDFLFQKLSKFSQKTILVPNACDFNHFNSDVSTNPLSKFQKPIIGYFGIIAEWFDVDLIEYLATRKKDASFVFIGYTYGSNLKKIKNLKNVHFLGERPYSELPKFLHNFDACIIPFKLTPLIKATHPIKVYEYLSAGKPVISTKIPELTKMDDVCYIAENQSDFLSKLNNALKEDNDKLIEKRIEFAQKNTWKKRHETIYQALEEIKDLKISEYDFKELAKMSD